MHQIPDGQYIEETRRRDVPAVRGKPAFETRPLGEVAHRDAGEDVGE